MNRGGWEGGLGAVGFDNLQNFQQNVLFDLVEVGPIRRLGKRVDKEIQGRRRKGIEIDHQDSRGIDLGVGTQHPLNRLDNRSHLVGVVIADADRLVDAAV